MREIPLPENISSEQYDTFRRILDTLDQQRVPTLRDKRSLGGIREGQSAYYKEGTKLYLYTKSRNRLHRIEYDAEAVAQPAAAAPSARNYQSELG